MRSLVFVLLLATCRGEIRPPPPQDLQDCIDDAGGGGIPCPKGQECLFYPNRAPAAYLYKCVPKPDSDGGCPPGFVYDPFGRSACELCNEGAAGCLPKE